MKTTANYLPLPQLATHADRPAGWMPARIAAQAVDTNHWLSRAARGLTWNRDGAVARRRPH